MNFVGLMKVEVEALYFSPRKPLNAYQKARPYLAEKQQLSLQILSKAIQSVTPTL